MKKLVQTLWACSLLACVPAVFAGEVKTTSPDGRLSVVVQYGEGAPLTWQVQRDGRPVVGVSPLGLVIGGKNIAAGVRSAGTPVQMRIDESYPVYGVHAQARNRCNETVIPLRGAGIGYELIVRSYDDGAAVRYRIASKRKLRLDRELTAWNLPATAHCFWAPYSIDYESLHQESVLQNIPVGEALVNPLTAVVGNGYVAVGEADCRTFADMGLVREGNLIRVCFPASPEGWTVEGELLSSWRAAIVADDLNGLVNSDLLTNLCPAPDPSRNFDWVKPGRVLWQWWSSEAPKFEEQQVWYDAAARLGWEYYLIDDGWRFWKEGDKDQWQCLKEVIDYGKSKGVQSVIWVDSKEMRTRAEIHDYLAKVKEAGAVGIKIDFIPAPTPEIMRWYQDALEETYDLQLLCNFHGCVKPSGLRRTWPHELTREAVRGHEFHISRYDRVMPMNQEAIKPFTRLLAGPADFTPTAFVPSELLGYTWPHELAQAIVYTSPLTHFADSYKWYLNSPVEDLLRDMPVVWDETIVLPFSEIGRVAGFVRRHGNEYWIGVVNGEDARTVSFDLGFLQGRALATVISDRPEADDALVREEKIVDRGETITVSLRKGGGYVMRLRSID